MAARAKKNGGAGDKVNRIVGREDNTRPATAGKRGGHNGKEPPVEKMKVNLRLLRMAKAATRDVCPGFAIVCEKCGSANVHIENTVGYSRESGLWGSIEIICDNETCFNTAIIFDAKE